MAVRADVSTAAAMMIRAEIRVTINTRDAGEREILLEASEAIYEELVKWAGKRGMSVAELIGEALRLEGVFTEAKGNGEHFLIGKNRDYRELLVV